MNSGTDYVNGIVFGQFGCPACTHVVPRLRRNFHAGANVNAAECRSQVCIRPVIAVAYRLRTTPTVDPLPPVQPSRRLPARTVESRRYPDVFDVTFVVSNSGSGVRPSSFWMSR